MLIVAIISMLCAVTAYTTAVFMERKAGTLLKKHIIVFCIGLFFDTLGTTAMGVISDGFSMDIHGLTGLFALILMFVHVVWAIGIFFKGNEKQKNNFHKFSLYVWMIWMVPFLTGMILNM